ncbi:hypothetical protein [Aporhodopirellula aestuarii]|uniref:Uncharacterized protein n=1 Tax=Aporhodopirellula aestuarii TaxID=2950107 RepID=A0ABT0TXJ4_9BACT|nr:hypothetical protein [Aporhodopirellula aestuarii]MCM2369304.1 hypothetical protein [Aporhodopirellula aestuarii]
MAITQLRNAAGRVSSRMIPSRHPSRRVNLCFTLVAVIAMPCVSLVGGCRLCADCDLESYPSYGGVWQRTLRDSGRVGSIFDPGGSRAADLSARVDADDADARRQQGMRSGGDDEMSDGEGAELNDDERSLDDREMNDSERRELDENNLREMEDRFRDLDLQDINYQAPSDESLGWE